MYTIYQHISLMQPQSNKTKAKKQLQIYEKKMR